MSCLRVNNSQILWSPDTGILITPSGFGPYVHVYAVRSCAARLQQPVACGEWSTLQLGGNHGLGLHIISCGSGSEPPQLRSTILGPPGPPTFRLPSSAKSDESVLRGAAFLRASATSCRSPLGFGLTSSPLSTNSQSTSPSSPPTPLMPATPADPDYNIEQDGGDSNDQRQSSASPTPPAEDLHLSRPPEEPTSTRSKSPSPPTPPHESASRTALLALRREEGGSEARLRPSEGPGVQYVEKLDQLHPHLLYAGVRHLAKLRTNNDASSGENSFGTGVEYKDIDDKLCLSPSHSESLAPTGATSLGSTHMEKTAKMMRPSAPDPSPPHPPQLQRTAPH
ncbi:hypothetical protein BDK51DRAFT_40071 [Blyttiomyces helicus]|uniref:Uncharacterized protein n=1 Tax=Blyttiomyces helicus TaxID=388810 RepID=A0A4P9WJX4_9FUNG|nr:hypothetical protein BDK51DRAFT_40071 [Blyttiomyces helicus]|eukprot:RKO91838.1 hypothetical protein BDK51DRAFT_40071 [Blyttiomyces helicus]